MAPGGGFTERWYCEKCGATLGTGTVKPSYASCPQCGVRFINGGPGPSFGSPAPFSSAPPFSSGTPALRFPKVNWVVIGFSAAIVLGLALAAALGVFLVLYLRGRQQSNSAPQSSRSRRR
jgi:hypothetical protein